MMDRKRVWLERVWLLVKCVDRLGVLRGWE